MTERGNPELPSPEEIFRQVENVPLSKPLLKAFKKYTDPNSWQVNKSSAGYNVEGETIAKKDKYDKRAFTLEKFYNEARLMVYI